MVQRSKFTFAALAVDLVIFSMRGNVLHVLLMQMKKRPFMNMWAVPGRLVRPKESVDEAAHEQRCAYIGTKAAYLEQLYTFGEVDRDPFGRVVSVAYFSLIPETTLVSIDPKPGTAHLAWFPVTKLPQMAYDHKHIITTAYERVQAKLGYSNIVCNLLPSVFTLSELQRVYESVLGTTFDKRNFRKKLLALGVVRTTGQYQQGLPNRPAELYTCARIFPTFVNVL